MLRIEYNNFRVSKTMTIDDFYINVLESYFLIQLFLCIGDYDQTLMK